jgi:hypothetical protein
VCVRRIWAEGEREEYERYRKESREFNIEAVASKWKRCRTVTRHENGGIRVSPGGHAGEERRHGKGDIQAGDSVTTFVL